MFVGEYMGKLPNLLSINQMKSCLGGIHVFLLKSLTTNITTVKGISAYSKLKIGMDTGETKQILVQIVFREMHKQTALS